MTRLLLVGSPSQPLLLHFRPGMSSRIKYRGAYNVGASEMMKSGGLQICESAQSVKRHEQNLIACIWDSRTRYIISHLRAPLPSLCVYTRQVSYGNVGCYKTGDIPQIDTKWCLPPHLTPWRSSAKQCSHLSFVEINIWNRSWFPSLHKQKGVLQPTSAG